MHLHQISSESCRILTTIEVEIERNEIITTENGEAKKK